MTSLLDLIRPAMYSSITRICSSNPLPSSKATPKALLRPSHVVSFICSANRWARRSIKRRTAGFFTLNISCKLSSSIASCPTSATIAVNTGRIASLNLRFHSARLKGDSASRVLRFIPAKTASCWRLNKSAVTVAIFFSCFAPRFIMRCQIARWASLPNGVLTSRRICRSACSGSCVSSCAGGSSSAPSASLMPLEND